MNTKSVPYDCSVILRGWKENPAQTITENLINLLELYSHTYRLLVLEIRRLETACNVDISITKDDPIQALVDLSIS